MRAFSFRESPPLAFARNNKVQASIRVNSIPGSLRDDQTEATLRQQTL
jgi:hypothetical protein